MSSETEERGEVGRGPADGAPGSPARIGAAGFTLVEAIVALTLTTVVVVLVSSVFLAQSNFYGDILRRSGAHDAARSVADLVGRDARMAVPEGIIDADSLRFVARVPVLMGMVCGISGNHLYFFFPEVEAEPDTANSTGYGLRDEDGSWAFYSGSWSSLHDGEGVTYKDACAAVGVDTVGIPTSHFVRLAGPGNTPVPAAEVGDAFMISRQIELTFAASALDTGTVALYRGTYQGDLVEYASGLSDDSHFRYRLEGDSVFYTSVSSGDLDRINSVRVVVTGWARGDGDLDDYEFELTQDVPLRNVR